MTILPARHSRLAVAQDEPGPSAPQLEFGLLECARRVGNPRLLRPSPPCMTSSLPYLTNEIGTPDPN